ncbi:MAG: hypothetical protein SFV53_04465 [Rickettsiales bacterium]|nr:hypothetical protein [Rickettsiales bacterium]
MNKPKVLLAGFYPDLGQALPFLLTRAGFEIEAISTKYFFNGSSFISNFFEIITEEDLHKKLDEIDLEIYQLIIIFDDFSLKSVANSGLSLSKKIKLLPLIDKKYFSHLGSKIFLSEFLQQGKILTPEFLVAKGRAEIKIAAQNLEFPLMVKADYSGGGDGVFECKNLADINLIPEEKLLAPVLLQKKIFGKELDLSAFYQNTKLIHFGYSEVEKTISKFGPSKLRTYKKLENHDAELFYEMQRLGLAIGASGFVNISAIKSEIDGKIYFIEADMRPNVWVDFTKFIDDDLAPKISRWFKYGEMMKFSAASNIKSVKILAPQFIRMAIWEILLNRYQVWRFMSSSDLKWFWKNIFLDKAAIFFWRLNRIPTLTFRKILPNKNHRKKLKRSIADFFLMLNFFKKFAYFLRQ